MSNAITGKAIISMINSAGVKALEKQTENTDKELIRQIAVNNLGNGIYIVQVMINNEELYYTKMVVKK